jgi:antitoxin (DNA-binding transcriptional repressor) of toxin-antitoxin stability system
MNRIKAVGVKELKNRLSAYLREVREGTVILVTDRENVVAELREPTVGRPLETANELEQEWIREGTLRPPRRSRTALRLPPWGFPEGTAQSLLDEERGQ